VKFTVVDESGNQFTVTSSSINVGPDGGISVLLSAVLHSTQRRYGITPPIGLVGSAPKTAVLGQTPPQSEKCKRCWDTGFIGGLGYPCSCGAGKGKR